MDNRLDDVLAARDAWAGLADDDRKAVLAAYERYDERAGSEHAAVEAALALLAAGVDSGPFAAIADLERDRLRAAADAAGGVRRRPSPRGCRRGTRPSPGRAGCGRRWTPTPSR